MIHGDEDAAIPVPKAAALAQGLHADLVVVPGAGHAANLTHADPVNTAMRAFLKTLPA